MEGNQKIHCTVENCKTKKADESMCSSYIYEKN